MEDRTNNLIEVLNEDGIEMGLFRVASNTCPEEHFKTAIQEYFNSGKQDAELLLTWGIQRVYVEHVISINFE